jgi:hypothetical protein
MAVELGRVMVKRWFEKMSSDKVLTNGTTCLKDMHLDFLSMFCIRKYLECKKIYLLIRSEFFMIQIHDFVKSLARNSMLLWFVKNYDVTLTMPNKTIFSKTVLKIVLYHAWGIAVSLKKDF